MSSVEWTKKKIISKSEIETILLIMIWQKLQWYYENSLNKSFFSCFVQSFVCWVSKFSVFRIVLQNNKHINQFNTSRLPLFGHTISPENTLPHYYYFYFSLSFGMSFHFNCGIRDRIHFNQTIILIWTIRPIHIFFFGLIIYKFVWSENGSWPMNDQCQLIWTMKLKNSFKCYKKKKCSIKTKRLKD